MLAPHDRKDPQFRVTRLAPEDAFEAIVFVRCEAVFLNQLRCDCWLRHHQTTAQTWSDTPRQTRRSRYVNIKPPRVISSQESAAPQARDVHPHDAKRVSNDHVPPTRRTLETRDTKTRMAPSLPRGYNTPHKTMQDIKNPKVIW